jgi:hypothetical protein
MARLQGDHLSPLLPNHVDGGLRCVNAQITPDDQCTFSRECPRGFPAHASAGSGNNAHFVLEPE